MKTNCTDSVQKLNQIIHVKTNTCLILVFIIVCMINIIIHQNSIFQRLHEILLCMNLSTIKM